MKDSNAVHVNRSHVDTNIRPRNRIVFGAPGTGKSFRINQEACRHKIKEDKDDYEQGLFESADGKDSRYERVTFYPTYSYAQFVGTYKPVMEEVEVAGEDDIPLDAILSEDELAKRLKTVIDVAKDEKIDRAVAVLRFAIRYYNSIKKVNRTRMFNKSHLPPTYSTYLSKGLSFAELQLETRRKESTIAYGFVPGPFLRVLVNALKEHEKNWCLIIEEINRANAAAVFGDVFQLLDRGSDGVSEYSIAASEDVTKYLQKELGESQYAMKFLNVVKKKDEQGNETEDWNSCSLRIPDNMYIWATMNSADQGVFPMDTAFKRRWAFEYIGVDDEAKDGAKCKKWTIKETKKTYNWNDVRRVINGLLAVNGVNEDKLMGPYFIQPDKIQPDKENQPEEEKYISLQAFSSKVLMYLWEDAGRMIRRNLFGNKINTYSQLVNKWEDVGITVFEKSNKITELKETIDPDIKKRLPELFGGSDD